MRYRIRRVSAVEGIECEFSRLARLHHCHPKRRKIRENFSRQSGLGGKGNRQSSQTDGGSPSLAPFVRTSLFLPPAAAAAACRLFLRTRWGKNEFARLLSSSSSSLIVFAFPFSVSLYLSLVLSGCSSSSFRMAVGSPPAFPPSFHQMSPLASASCSSPSFAL